MYAASLAALFSDYPKNVVLYATDPRTGIASEFKWFPAIHEVRSFLDATRQRLHRLAQPSYKPAPKHYPPPVKLDFANSFVPSDHPRYDAFVTMRESDPDWSYYGELNGKQGLWVPLGWVELVYSGRHKKIEAAAPQGTAAPAGGLVF